MNRQKILSLAINKLAIQFKDLDLSFHQIAGRPLGDVTSYWPGDKDEDILVCVFKGTRIKEPFHRQDFFFINYAYEKGYQALSEKYNHLIEINEDDCYIGQPYSGYALRANREDNVTIIGILIRKNTFFHEYLFTVYTNPALFNFFTIPQKNKFSEEYIHLSLTKDHAIRTILEMMVIEYADKQQDTQQLLKAMLKTLLLEISRRYAKVQIPTTARTMIDEILEYIEEHSDMVTLKDIADHFGYHPNYISSLLHKETGSSFTDILLKKRMERALVLLRNTTLSIEEISSLLGYNNHSNFYKAFKKYYGLSPREYIKESAI